MAQRLQINVGGFAFSRDSALVNVFQGTAQQWGRGDGDPDHAFDMASLDANGWPLPGTEFNGHSGANAIYKQPPQSSRPGSYYVIADGYGSVTLTSIGGGTPITIGTSVFSGGTDQIGGPWAGADIGDTTEGGYPVGRVQLNLTATGDDSSHPHMTNIRIVHADDLTAFMDGTKRFQDKFMQRLDPFDTIRFMNMQYDANNICNQVFWADRMPETYWSYAASMFPAANMAGTTSYNATTGQYTLAKTGFTLVDGTAVICIFGQSQSYAGGPSTLNVNSTGDIPLARMNGIIRDPTIPDDAYLIVGGVRRSCCTYDESLNVWMVYHDPAYYVDYGIACGSPIEMMIDMANQSGKHPWFTAPYKSCDMATADPELPALSDYHAGLSALCIERLDAGLVPIFEGPNEIWQPGNMQTEYCWQKQKLRSGGGFDQHIWYGMVMSLIGQEKWSSYGVSAKDTTKFRVMCGFQAGDETFKDERLTSSYYVSQGGQPASDYVTDICIDSYWQSSYYGTATESTWADEYVSNPTLYGTGGASDRVTPYVEACLDTVGQLGTNGNYSIPLGVIETIDWPEYVTAATSYGVGLWQYEASYALESPPGSNLEAFRRASEFHPLMETYVKKSLDDWAALGSVCKTASIFGLSGVDGWSVLVPDVYVGDGPKWSGVMDFFNEDRIILGDYILDNGLNALNALTDKILLCTAQPTDYAAAVSLTIGNKTGTGIFGTPTSGTPSGQKVSLNAITDGTITTAGSVTWWAAVDSSGSNLLASGAVDTPKSVTTGNFSLGTFDITLLAN